MFFLIKFQVIYRCDCVCINHPFSVTVECGAKLAYSYSVYKSLFNSVLISRIHKTCIWLVYTKYGYIHMHVYVLWLKLQQVVYMYIHISNNFMYMF